MAFRRNDQYLVWRTNGGLYVSSQGRTGKLCVLRESPYGVEWLGPDLSAHYEVIRTRYGRRYRLIEPEEVWPGMTVYISPLLGGWWVQTSEIQEVYRGVRVDSVAPGAEFLVFGRNEAALFTDPDEGACVMPLYESGWFGQPANQQSFGRPDSEHRTILRVEPAYCLEPGGNESRETVPGWQHVVATLRRELSAIDPQIEIEHVDANPSDGLLRVELSEVPGEEGRPLQEVREAVLDAMVVSAVTCTECGNAGTITTIRNEDGASMKRALCEGHAVEQLAAEAVFLEEPVVALPPELEHVGLEVGPGWYRLLAKLCRQVGELTPYTLLGCRQDQGDLVTQIDLPADTATNVRIEVRRLEQQAREEAAVTCEHCGDPGERDEFPWLHPCCSECDDAEREMMQLETESDDDE
ncbi:hypothetical protein [Leucobacter sp. GX24907]